MEHDMTTIAANEQPRALTADELDQVAGGSNAVGNTPNSWGIRVAGMNVSWDGKGANVSWRSGGTDYSLWAL
jgi:hypothetical protein